MPLGSQLLMGALDASYTPTVNPDIANATHVDQQGNYVKVDPQTGATTIVPAYVQPNWFQRAVSPTAREYSSFNAQSAAAPAIAKQRAFIERNTAESLDPTLNNTTYAQTYDPRFNPSNRNAATQASALAATGAPQIVGNLGGQTDINTAHQMLAESQASLQRSPVVNAAMDAEASNKLAQSTNVDPLTIRHSINILRSQLGQDPTEAQILDNINQAKLKESQVGVSDAGINAATQHNANVIGNIQSSRMSPFPYYTSRINSDSSISAPSHDPLGMSPMQAQFGAMQAMGGNMGVGQPVQGQLSSGKSFTYNPPPPREYPSTIGNQGSSASQPQLPMMQKTLSIRAVNDYPEYSADYSTGRLYYKGQDVTDNPQTEPIKQAAIEQGHKEMQESKEAEHDARQAALKAESKRLKAEHLRTGLLPLIGRGTEDAGSSVGKMFKQVGSDYSNAANKYVGQPIYNALIGQ